MPTCGCGNDFTARRSDARYCSPACQKAGQRAGQHVHFTQGQSDTTPAPDGEALTGAPPASEASTRRLARTAIPEVVACRAPVYAAGAIHGPVYDAKGNQVRRTYPEPVGYLDVDGRFERLGRRSA